MYSLSLIALLALELLPSASSFPLDRIPINRRDVGLWPDSFLQKVANEAAKWTAPSLTATEQTPSPSELQNDASPLAVQNDVDPDSADDPNTTGSAGSLGSTPLYNPSGLSPALPMTGADTPVADTFTQDAFATGSFSSSGWNWQSTGLFQYGGCDISVSPGLISQCYNMQLSGDPTQDLEPGEARQRIEIYASGAEPETTWTYTWKSASPTGTGSTQHFFHTWQILSRGGGGAAVGPVVYLDFVNGAAAIGDVVRCKGICGQNGQGVSLASYEGRVISHSMTVTFGPNGALSYTASDAVSNTKLITYQATGEMGGTNLTSLKFGLYRLAVSGMTPARAFVGDFSAVQTTSGGLTVGSLGGVGLPTTAGAASTTMTSSAVSSASTTTTQAPAPTTTSASSAETSAVASPPSTTSTTTVAFTGLITSSSTSTPLFTIPAVTAETPMVPFPNVENITATIAATITTPAAATPITTAAAVPTIATVATLPAATTVAIPTIATVATPAAGTTVATVAPATTGVTPTCQTHSGPATWYQVGENTGACGWNYGDQDMVLAVNTADYAGGVHCGQMVNVAGGVGSFQAKVVDECPTCDPGGLDLSPQAFQILGALDAGVIPMTWSFV